MRSQFQPEFEYRDAVELAQKLGARMRTLSVDVLSDPRVTANPADRCYYCKQNIMTAIRDAARQDGYEMICDGTNASDDLGDRPGARALREYGIRSPLRECGLTKSMIRERSKEAGLPVWNKPAYACLATRILTGEEITAEKLRTTEQAESLLFSMGFRDFRVRMRGDAALIQVTGEQYEQALSMQEEISKTLAGMYSDITIDDRTR